MKAKEIIALNNEKQTQLNTENEQDFEDMLVYIRVSSTKSEQQTEEVLLELLEHILLAQNDGKNVRDIFGDDLKGYCQDLIGEIPKETKKKQFKFGLRIILIFLAVASLFNGVSDLGLYYIFGLGKIDSIYYLGSSIGIILINLVIAFLGIVLVFSWIKSTLFQKNKKTKKREFFELWLIMVVILGLFICVLFFMPDFGTPFNVSSFVFLPLGLGLYALTYLFKD